MGLVINTPIIDFNVIDDRVVFQLVIARPAEPTSKFDSVRVRNKLGVDDVHRNTFLNSLVRAN